MTHIQMAGIDHALAPVEIRERFAFTNADAREAMGSWADQEPVTGCLLLTTCNRTELWASATTPVDLLSLLCRWKGMDPEPVRPLFRTLEDEEAVTYLFHLAGGLRSRILGEDQILGQVKEALARAREAGVCGSTLEVLFRSAITGAKQVKTRLCLRTANASAAELAIGNLAGRLPMEGLPCLVIGNGEMGKRAAAALLQRGARVTVTVRQYHSGHVEVLPGCRRVEYGRRYGEIPNCRLVVSATASPNVTINARELGEVAPGTLFLDLAVPRDIDPAVGHLPGVTLYNIDDFSLEESEQLQAQLSEARQLLEAEMAHFFAWFQCRELIPQVERVARAFAGGDPLEEKRLKRLLFTLRDRAGAQAMAQCLEAMKEVLAHEGT